MQALTQTEKKSRPGPTPGPWRVEQGTTLVWGACNRDDQSNYGMGYPIAECRITPSSSWAKGPNADEGEANAHLIAAAPDMLDFIRQIAKRDPVFAKGHEKQVIADARALVTKAEGRS